MPRNRDRLTDVLLSRETRRAARREARETRRASRLAPDPNLETLRAGPLSANLTRKATRLRARPETTPDRFGEPRSDKNILRRYGFLDPRVSGRFGNAVNRDPRRTRGGRPDYYDDIWTWNYDDGPMARWRNR